MEEKIYLVAACTAITIILVIYMTILALLQSLMDRKQKQMCIDAFLERIENEIECRKAEQMAFVKVLYDNDMKYSSIAPEDVDDAMEVKLE